MTTEAPTSAPARAQKKKPPASKKAAPKKPAAKRATAGRDAMTITVKSKENAYGGSRGERFALLRTGMTVAEYVVAAERKGHKRSRAISLFERDKHITLSATR